MSASASFATSADWLEPDELDRTIEVPINLDPDLLPLGKVSLSVSLKV